MNDYLTVKLEGSDEFEIKHSRFIGYVKPVTTSEGAVAFINEIKSKHWDAKHNVYAYILRDGQLRRYSDDGEPQGTAGMPVLDVLQKSGVCDCAVVVTRYFGGILLGGGGLVRAYSHAASLALNAGQIVKMSLFCICEMTVDYNLYGKLPTLISDFGGEITESKFEADVEIHFRLPLEGFEKFEEKYRDLSFGKGTINVIGQDYFESL